MQAKSDIVMSLSDASAELPQVGGKGASLARLAAAGLPVPPDFHITTAAYRRFVAEHKLQEQILAAVSAAAPDQPATLEEASSRIGKLFAQHAMPDDIAAAIRRAYAKLGEGGAPAAVRSSAATEDLPEMSFAGMDEYVGRRRLRMKAMVTAVLPGRKVVWQFKQAVRLPAHLILEAADEAEGILPHAHRRGWLPGHRPRPEPTLSALFFYRVRTGPGRTRPGRVSHARLAHLLRK